VTNAHRYPKRYFLLTNGRSGSSLLAAVLADAGADFGMAAPESWDPQTGQMENAAVKHAAHHYRRAYDIERGRGFNLLPRYEAKLRWSRGRRWLRRALDQASYLKIGDMDLLAQPAFRLGYLPQLILIYRRFEPNLASLIVGRTHAGPDELAREYVRIYRQGLLLMHCFGGCAIGYEQLVDPQQRQWAAALAAVTGLSEAKLLQARSARLSGTMSRSQPDVSLYPDLDQLYDALEAESGKPLAPSAATIRAIQVRVGSAAADAVN
jgi:hypothetical protein